MYIWNKYSGKLEKHLLRGLFCCSCGITYHSLLKVKSNKRALLEIWVSKYETSSHLDMNENLRFKQLWLNYIQHKKKTGKKKKKRKEHLRLVLNSIRVGTVVKTDDEIYVLGTIKIYSYFPFVSSTVPKKVELLKISKVMWLLWKSLLSCKNGREKGGKKFRLVLIASCCFPEKRISSFLK